MVRINSQMCNPPEIKSGQPKEIGCSTPNVQIPTVKDLVKKGLGMDTKPIGCSTPDMPVPNLYDVFKKAVFGQKK